MHYPPFRGNKPHSEAELSLMYEKFLFQRLANGRYEHVFIEGRMTEGSTRKGGMKWMC